MGRIETGNGNGNGLGLLLSIHRQAVWPGLRHAADKAWLAGGSPTYGFLAFGTKGPSAEMYAAIAGNAVVDWLFMLDLAFVGATLLLGLAVRLGAYAGGVDAGPYVHRRVPSAGEQPIPG